MAFHWLRFVKGPPGSRQLPFGPGTKTCMRPVIQRDRFGGSGHAHLLSCCLSAAAVGFLSRPVPATGFRLLPTGGRSFPPDRDEVPTFHTYELRPVPGAPFTPGSWCSPGRILDSSQHCRIPAADPLPQKKLPSPGLGVTRLTGVHLIHPSGLPLSCRRWMDHRLLGFLPVLRTPQRSRLRRTPRAGTGAEHSPGTTRRSSRPSIPDSSLTMCDLVSQPDPPVIATSTRPLPSRSPGTPGDHPARGSRGWWHPRPIPC